MAETVVIRRIPFPVKPTTDNRVFSSVTRYHSGSQPGVHGPLSGPQKILGGPHDSKFCITVNRRGPQNIGKLI